ncbi:unnamed protein product, partial [Heterosigma akashiwo]
MELSTAHLSLTVQLTRSQGTSITSLASSSITVIETSVYLNHKETNNYAMPRSRSKNIFAGLVVFDKYSSRCWWLRRRACSCVFLDPLSEGTGELMVIAGVFISSCCSSFPSLFWPLVVPLMSGLSLKPCPSIIRTEEDLSKYEI